MALSLEALEDRRPKKLPRYGLEEAVKGNLRPEEIAVVSEYYKEYRETKYEQGRDRVYYVAGITFIEDIPYLVFSGSVDHNTQFIESTTLRPLQWFFAYDVVASLGFKRTITTKIDDYSHLCTVDYKLKDSGLMPEDIVVTAAYNTTKDRLNKMQRGEDRVFYVAGRSHEKGLPVFVYTGSIDHASQIIQAPLTKPERDFYSYNFMAKAIKIIPQTKEERE